MKPPRFDYLAPETVADAVAARAASEDSALLAGGQSLIPSLNFRIANPKTIIDLGRIEALRGIAVEASHIAVRAMVRQRELELDETVHRANPLIRETLGNVSHIVVRNRGTVAGSIAHADAAAELPALLLATGGAVIAEGPGGPRTIAADDLFRFHLTTTLEPDEIITEVRFPVLPPHTGWAFREFARRRGDYALAGVCVLVTVDDRGQCVAARLSACGIASSSVRLAAVEQALHGVRLDDAAIAAAATRAREAVTASDDTQATTAFRQNVLETLVRRAVAQAAARAGDAA